MYRNIGFDSLRVRKTKAEFNEDGEIDFREFVGLGDMVI
jgi:hypothetical protein